MGVAAFGHYVYYISYLVTLMKRREKRPILGRDIHLNRQGNSLQMKNDAGRKGANENGELCANICKSLQSWWRSEVEFVLDQKLSVN